VGGVARRCQLALVSRGGRHAFLRSTAFSEQAYRRRGRRAVACHRASRAPVSGERRALIRPSATGGTGGERVRGRGVFSMCGRKRGGMFIC